MNNIGRSKNVKENNAQRICRKQNGIQYFIIKKMKIDISSSQC